MAIEDVYSCLRVGIEIGKWWGWRARQGAAVGLVKVRPKRRRKRPPAWAETPAKAPRARGQPQARKRRERRFRKASPHPKPPGRTLTGMLWAQWQGQQPSGWKASPQPWRFRASRAARARDKDTSRGPMRPPERPGGRRKPTRKAERVERKGPALQASKPGRAEMDADAKVPWKCARPAAAAPADEVVSAGADRTAHVLRKEGHDTVAAGGNTSGH